MAEVKIFSYRCPFLEGDANISGFRCTHPNGKATLTLEKDLASRPTPAPGVVCQLGQICGDLCLGAHAYPADFVVEIATIPSPQS